MGVEGAEVMEGEGDNGEEREEIVSDNEDMVDGVEKTLGDLLEGDFIFVVVWWE